MEKLGPKVKSGLALQRLNITTQQWLISGQFRISRSSLTQIEVVSVEISDGAHKGRAECRPYARYNESAASVTAQIDSIREPIENGATPESLQGLLPAGAARNAVDCALWDLRAKMRGESLSDMLGIAPPRARQTAYTLSLDSPAKMGQAAIEAKNYPLIKIKIGAKDGLNASLAVLKARPDVSLIIDANEALAPGELKAFRAALSGKNVAMIEQPLPAKGFDKIDNDPSKLPIYCADESLHGIADLEPLWEAGYRAVNVKLDKCGGLSAALALMQAAKAKGFTVMAGCMVGTSLAMAPMMILEQFADYIDLDGPLLLAKDIENGLKYEGAIIHPPNKALWG